jgi:hypothetical protein
MEIPLLPDNLSLCTPFFLPMPPIVADIEPFTKTVLDVMRSNGCYSWYLFLGLLF